MGAKILNLVADTGLLIQCRPLAELPWDTLGAFDELSILICRPVQAEIDGQKARGNDRLGRRARAASALVRRAILEGDGSLLVREDAPVVCLRVVPELRPDPDVADRLDYRERDDQLVGILSACRRHSEGVEVRLLTHDTGPMALVRMLGLTVEPIPDSWLLPPEQTEAEKRVVALESEIAVLRRQEPQFRITFPGGTSSGNGDIALVVLKYDPLTDPELVELRRVLSERFPMVTEREANAQLGLLETAARRAIGETLVPPDPRDFEAYKAHQYPDWLDLDLLGQLPRELQRSASAPTVRCEVVNSGTRPGDDVLVSITARGRFRVLPPPPSRTRRTKARPKLPPPPTPPMASFRRPSWLSAGDVLSQFGDSRYGALSAMSHLVQPPTLLPSIDLGKRDPNGFYWKPQRPKRPTTSVVLECQQWRHGSDPEGFEVELHSEKGHEDVVGVLECRVEAANMGSVVVESVRVRMTTERRNAYDTAIELIEELSSRRSIAQ